MADVTLDDIQLALVPVSKKSASVYKSVVVLYKSIFRAAKESRIIENNPTVYLTSKGGGVPQKEKEALTDEQAARLLDAIQGLPPYVFVMLGLYAGLRREEILALQQLALVPVSKKSASVYKSVVVLYKSIFRAAKESRIIENNPTVYLTSKGGGVPQKEKEALTDEQAARLLDAIQGLPPYVFVMLGLYAGLRREEILALQWDSVYLDTDTPYLTVRRAWHTESNRPVILDELKTKAAERNIPLPICLADCLREAKANSASEYVVPNRDGNPLSYTQFKRLWQYIVTRTTKERVYYRYEDGKRVQHTVTPVLGEKAAHNGKVVYSLDFEVTPHQLRHTYITNLIHSSVDPKTVQYLAGHESSKITMDIYAKVKYNRPDEIYHEPDPFVG